MNETDDLARAINQAITDAVTALPVRVAVGKLANVEVDFLSGAIGGVAVNVLSRRMECEWLGAFAAEVVALRPVSPVGREVLVEFVNGRAIVTGIIWTGV